jgi:acetyltransferase-like isoleucine patch superfamily enzyme
MLYIRLIRLLRTKTYKFFGVRIGFQSRIYHACEIQNPKKIEIGNKSTIYQHTSLFVGNKGSFKLGNNSHIAPYGYCLIDNNSLEIGNNVAIGPFTSIFCHSNSPYGPSAFFTENYIDGDISIGNNVFIGAHCVILPGTKIHDDVVIASNSVIKGQIPSDSIYGGSPAKQIKKL